MIKVSFNPYILIIINLIIKKNKKNNNGSTNKLPLKIKLIFKFN